MKKLSGFLVFFLSFIFLLQPVLAVEVTDAYTALQFIWVDIFGFTLETFTWNGLIFSLLLPFFALALVILGFLSALKLFRGRIQIALAIIIALISLPTKGLATLVYWSSVAIGGWSWIVFVFLFIAGTIAYSATRIKGWHGEYSLATAELTVIRGLEARLKEITQEETTMAERLGRKEISIANYNSAMDKLERERASLIDRIRTLKKQF